MVYVKQTWADEDPNRPVSAARLNYIENGIEAASDALDALDADTIARVEPRDINLRDAGVSPANTAAVNTAAFTAAIASAPNGSRLLLPYDPSPVLINDALTVPPDKTLRFAGLGGRTKIAQTVWPKPVFDLNNAHGSTIEDFELSMSQPRAATAGSYRDGGIKTYASAVWVAANNVAVRRVTASGFTAAIRLTNWVQALGARSGFASDIVFEDILSTGCDWGIVGTGWRRVVCRNISGDYSLTPASGDPSHLIYLSSGQPNEDVTVENCTAYNGTGGSAYSFKTTNGLKIKGITSRNCAGFINLESIVVGDLSGLYATDDTGDVDNGSIYMFGTNENVTIRDLVLKMGASVRAIRLAGADVKLRDARITVAHTTDKQTGDVYVASASRALLEDVRITTTGGGSNVGILVDGACSDVTVRGGGGAGVFRFVQVASGATRTAIHYDPAETTPKTSVSGYRVALVSPAIASTRVYPSRAVVPFATGTGQAVQVRADMVTHAQVTVSGASNFTVSMVEPFVGADVTVRIINATAGAIGTVTWSGITLASAWSNPAAGESIAVRLFYDGTSWRETYRGP